jgi:hypothetical protein
MHRAGPAPDCAWLAATMVVNREKGTSMLETTDQATGTHARLTPGAFCRLLLRALEAAEGQTRRRKRDQAPDRLGLTTKRELLERAVMADPTTEAFEGWLVEQIAGAEAPGAVRAMCEQIFLEYRMARLQPELTDWLMHGAPSDDAEPGRGRRHADREPRRDRWHGTDDTEYACTCHLPQH